MQSPSHQFFPGAGRAGYQHSSEMRCDSPKLREYLQHERATAHNPCKPTSIQEFVLEFLGSMPGCSFRKQFRDPTPQLFHTEWLVEVISCPFLNGLNR